MYLYKFLRLFRYRIDKNDFSLSYRTHPKYPNITAISETFDQYGVDSTLAEVPKNMLRKLPVRFIGLLQMDDVLQTVFVHKRKTGKLFVTSSENQKKQYTEKQFLDVWTGIVLGVTENTSSSDDIAIQGNRKKMYYGLLSFLLILLLFSFKQLWFSPLIFLYFLLSSFGLYLNYLILKKKIGLDSNNFNKLCSTVKKSSCDNILFNDERLLLNLGFNDLSLIYFVFTFFISFFILQFDLSGQIFNITLLSVPILFYSIYYQIVRLKSICVICLQISLIVIVQLLISGSINNFTIGLEIQKFSVLSLILSIVALIWVMLKEKVLILEDLQSTFTDYHRLIRSEKIFNVLGEEYGGAEINYKSISPFILRQKDHNKNQILLILSSKCSGCRLAYSNLKKIMTYFGEELNVYLIFDLRNTPIDVKKVFSRLIQINEASKLDATKALDDWFLHRSSTKLWQDKWGEYNSNISDTIKTHNQFLTKNKLYQSPKIFFNEKELSGFYTVKDLIYFLKRS